MDKYRILVKGIVRHENKYLLVQKWYSDNFVNPCRWEFVDGELEIGEAPDRAVLRVIAEKTGLVCEVEKTLYTWSFEQGDQWNIGISFLCTSDHGEIYLSEELSDYIWVSKEEFSDYIQNESILKDIARVEF